MSCEISFKNELAVKGSENTFVWERALLLATCRLLDNSAE